MGHVIPDRMFWAQPDIEDIPLTEEETLLAQTMDMHTSDTKH
jgi:hypothetical protein